MNGDFFSSFSIGCGAAFLPPARTIRSFLRSVIARKPSVVELPDVAGVEPALRVDRLGRRLRLVVVALHDVRAAGQDLAVGGDLDLDARDRPADRAQPPASAAR